MDELRGPTIQIVLHIREGLGFGFMKSPFVVSGSLNGYMLETDPAVPCHAPAFDAELVWEADKKRFRNLRVQNVPIKVEVYTTGTQGRKSKIGYLLLSLLSAQPCPGGKNTEVKYTWHRLLGVKTEGKCCQPQIMMSLSIEDRMAVPTPRNELRMFHASEAVVTARAAPPGYIIKTVNEYKAESGRRPVTDALQPRPLPGGLLQVGEPRHLFAVSFVVAAVENVDALLPEYDASLKESNSCYITYSVFSHEIKTDSVVVNTHKDRPSAMFNQKSSLRLKTKLTCLGQYFQECPLVVIKLCSGENDLGVCSVDLRKLAPTDQLEQFLAVFGGVCAVTERCFLLPCPAARGGAAQGGGGGARPYLDVEMSLRYIGDDLDGPPLTTRSATQLAPPPPPPAPYKSDSCSNLGELAPARARVADDAAAATEELSALVRRMCDTLARSQPAPRSTGDMQVQAHDDRGYGDVASQTELKTTEGYTSTETHVAEECIKNEVESDKDLDVKKEEPTCEKLLNEKVPEPAPALPQLPPHERDVLMQKYVDELETWRERQETLYKIQLQRKEEYHLERLSAEWGARRAQLEARLRSGVEQCRHLAAALSAFTEDMRVRAGRFTQLREAKKALEEHYRAQYQSLRAASRRLEDDLLQQLRAKDTRIEELETSVMGLERQMDIAKNNLRNVEEEAESKHSGLTKDQTASLIQELRCLEEKLENAAQSKAFFKEQWGRAVRELHLLKRSSRQQLLTQLQHSRRQLAGEDPEEVAPEADPERLRAECLLELLAAAPDACADNDIDGMDVINELCAPRNPMNEKLNHLISRRDELVQQSSPNEDELKRLNQEIRGLLLNYGI